MFGFRKKKIEQRQRQIEDLSREGKQVMRESEAAYVRFRDASVELQDEIKKNHFYKYLKYEREG